MTAIEGRTIHPGVAVGPIRLYRRENPLPDAQSQLTPGEEWTRFQAAQALAAAQLGELLSRTRARLGDELGGIFQIQAAMLDDPDFLDAAQARIRLGDSAQAAALAAGEGCAAMLLATGDELLSARAADARDLGRRLFDILTGQTAAPHPQAGILAADELSPSEAAELNCSALLGLVTRHDSPNGHTAILARAMGLPFLTGVELDQAWEGKQAVLDANQGLLFLDPSQEAITAAQAELCRPLSPAHSGGPCLTKDGQQVLLFANIGSSQQAQAAQAMGCDGVGLFRSEFLFLGRDTCPTEEEQFAAYRQTVLAMDGKRVVIRTLDVGADKQAPCLAQPPEPNPELGCRGIRYSLAHPQLLRTQLRAILRAASFGPVGVMFPLVVSTGEVRAAKAVLEQCRAELEREGLPYGALELGVMIETPAAVVLTEALAQEVDFFSIGTNDLTQYTLAADRQDPSPEAVYDPRHPAVLALIRHTVETGKRLGRRVELCGELAADPDGAELLVRMGLRELSAAPAALPALRERITQLDLSV